MKKKKPIKFVGLWILSWLDLWMFNMAKRKANRLHRLTNKEFRVINTDQGYKVFHSSQIKELKKRGALPVGKQFEVDKYVVYTTLQLKQAIQPKSHQHAIRILRSSRNSNSNNSGNKARTGSRLRRLLDRTSKQ